MPANKWLDRTQPQTLVTATMLLYLNAALSLLFLAFSVSPIVLVAIALQVLGGWGVANEKKWGYWLSTVVAGILVLFTLYELFGLAETGTIINLIFYGALFALLVHPMSRGYYRTWFR